MRALSPGLPSGGCPFGLSARVALVFTRHGASSCSPLPPGESVGGMGLLRNMAGRFDAWVRLEPFGKGFARVEALGRLSVLERL